MVHWVPPDEEDNLNSLAIALPLALAGFIVAAGCWSLFAVAGVHIRDALALTSVQFGLMLALPMASGALLAVPAGLAAQKFGSVRIMILCLGGLAVSMLLLMKADTFAGFLFAGAGLGLAAGYYSAGLEFVTQHASPRHMGRVLGIFGGGITGIGLSYYLVPLILEAFAWRVVPLAYLIVLLLILVLLVLLTDREDPSSEASPETTVLGALHALVRFRLWQIAGWFGVVAGSFFALALWLPDYLASHYDLPVGHGAGMAQWFVLPGAAAQVLGGYLADRHGSPRVVTWALGVCLVALFVLSYPPMTLYVEGKNGRIEIEFMLPLLLAGGFMVLLGVALGCAMAGLQRMMVVQNRRLAGFAAGILLVSACSVAFILPVLFSAVNQWLGVRSAVFMILFLLLACSLILFASACRREERLTLLRGGI
ncbi:MFS transporter, NNP family, nitrate/nitrite transporter [Marinobacter daqiaonensis]|uniref:MFS transporter, NNP family, nitrate/nitrite transporter n=1 Tax=Marinobacter daqiaonensis TaxID=650891 RepID=A0A1I6HQ11_9GAMM|nr:MFS transporter [Marinobacter daqiaonensis]SFR56360.1 MFS transporter, NNP family, nitrate/nitrite transporter [Marinobacter daqiaonensis]